MNAIKTFRDLLAFLTIIPLGKTEDFVATSAKNMYVFPVIGAFIGALAAGYFVACKFLVTQIVASVAFLVHVQLGFLVSVAPAAMTLAFLLVLTGFQHFDGLVDLGNALGLKRVEDRRAIAHAWTVTYKGAILAIAVEFLAFAGLAVLDLGFAVRALVVAEVGGKLGMVAIAWVGKPAHAGLGARFLGKAKRRLNVLAFIIAFAIGFVLLGVAGLLIVAAAGLFGVFMEQVGKSVFGGVSGDMIGATNEAARALCLVLTAVFSLFLGFLLLGGMLL